jgi:ABC-type transport system substrate-binding protein
VEILDNSTVKVTYKRLFSPAINAWTMGILPEHVLNEEALLKEMDDRGISEAAREAFGVRDSQFNRSPMGSGRFTFSEWHSDEYIHLTRFEEYWEGPPEYQEYYMRIIPDLLTQEVEFHAGAVDYYGTQPHQVASNFMQVLSITMVPSLIRWPGIKRMKPINPSPVWDLDIRILDTITVGHCWQILK